MNEEPPRPSPWVTSITGTPAASSAATIALTSSLVNWWRLWCDPSRSDVSVIRTSQIAESAAHYCVPPVTASVSLAISSPTLVAAAVMMSRLPAYGGR